MPTVYLILSNVFYSFNITQIIFNIALSIKTVIVTHSLILYEV